MSYSVQATHDPPLDRTVFSLMTRKIMDNEGPLTYPLRHFQTLHIVLGTQADSSPVDSSHVDGLGVSSSACRCLDDRGAPSPPVLYTRHGTCSGVETLADAWVCAAVSSLAKRRCILGIAES